MSSTFLPSDNFQVMPKDKEIIEDLPLIMDE
jgi:hypothetical protein